MMTILTSAITLLFPIDPSIHPSIHPPSLTTTLLLELTTWFLAGWEREEQRFTLNALSVSLLPLFFYWVDAGPPAIALRLMPSVPMTSHLNVVVQSPSLHWGGSKWLVNFSRVSSSADFLVDNSSCFLSLLSNAWSHMDSILKPK